MASQVIVGFVKELTGSATAISKEGSIRFLKVGDPIYAEEVLHANAASNLIVNINNAIFSVNPDSDFRVDPSLALNESANPSGHMPSDLEKIQQAILEGKDPSKVEEAPEAGNTASGLGHEGSMNVVKIELESLRGPVTSGYPTKGIEFNYPKPPIGAPDYIRSETAILPPVIHIFPYKPAGQVNGKGYFKEDQADAGVHVSASASAGSELTKLIIEHLSWEPNLNALKSLGFDVIFNSGTLQINFKADANGHYPSSFDQIIELIPTEDKDADINNVQLTVFVQGIGDPARTASASEMINISVDAVLDEAAQASQDHIAQTVQASSEQDVGLNLNTAYVNAGFSYSGAGGADSDGSEKISSVIIDWDSNANQGATLVLGGSSSLILQYNNGQYELKPIAGTQVNNDDYLNAIKLIQVHLPAGASGNFAGAIHITTAESFSDKEADSSDNYKITDTSFKLSVVGTPTTSISVDAQGDSNQYFKEDVANTVHLTASTTANTDQLTAVSVSQISQWISDKADFINAIMNDVNKPSYISGVEIDNQGNLIFELDPSAKVQSFSYNLTLTPPEDSDVDLNNVMITAKAQSIDYPGLTTTGSYSTDFVVDAVLDDAAQASQAQIAQIIQSANDQTIGLNLNTSTINAGFGYSVAGGIDSDSSEKITQVKIDWDSTYNESEDWVSLSLSGASFNLFNLTYDPDTHQYEIKAARGKTVSNQDYLDAIESLQVHMPANAIGNYNGKISIITTEAVSDTEIDAANNTKTLEAPFSLSIVGIPATSIEIMAQADGSQIFKEDAANTVQLTANTAANTDQLTVVTVSQIGIWISDKDGFINAILNDINKPDHISNVKFDSQDNLIFNLDPSAKVQSFSYDLILTPPEDSDLDLNNVVITAEAQSIVYPGLIAQGSNQTDFVVDAILDDAAQAAQAQVAQIAQSASEQAVALDLSIAYANAGFNHSGVGGSDSDSSEKITQVKIDWDSSYYNQGATLILTDKTDLFNLNFKEGKYFLVNKVDVSNQDYLEAIESLQVYLPANASGNYTGQIYITTSEILPNNASRTAQQTEPNFNDNEKVTEASFNVSVVGIPTTSIEVTAQGDGNQYFKEDVANTVHLTASTAVNTDQLTAVSVSQISQWIGDKADFINAIMYDVNKPSYISGVEIDNQGNLIFKLDPSAKVQSFSYDLTLIPPEDSDVDLNNVVIKAEAQSIDYPGLITKGSSSTDFIVDAVLDDVTQASQAQVAQAVQSNSVQNISLGLSSNFANAGFIYSGSGGANSDSSEKITQVTIDWDSNYYNQGATLVLEGNSSLVLEYSNGQYELKPIAGGQVNNADYLDAINSLQVHLPANAIGNFTGAIHISTAEALSGQEFDNQDNKMRTDTNFNLVVYAPPSASAVVSGGGFWYEDTANTVQLDYKTQQPGARLTEIKSATVSDATGWQTNLGNSVTFTDNNGTHTINLYSPTAADSAYLSANVSSINGVAIDTVLQELANGSFKFDAKTLVNMTMDFTNTSNISEAKFNLNLTPPTNSAVDLQNIYLSVQEAIPGLSNPVSTTANTAFYVDAVADMPLVSATMIAPQYGWQYTEKGKAINGGNGKVHVNASFTDMDGSEVHTVKIMLSDGFKIMADPINLPIGVTYSYINDANNNHIGINFTLPSSMASFSQDLSVTANSNKFIGNPVVTVVANAQEMVIASPSSNDFEYTLANNNAQATATATTNILTGTIITNTNITDQNFILSFVDMNNPYHAYAQTYNLPDTGQETKISVFADVGFNIDPNGRYLTSTEHATDGTKVIITDMTLEGVKIVDQGNEQITALGGQVSGDSGGKPFAFTAIIDPDQTSPFLQYGHKSINYSIDGTIGRNITTVNNPADNTINYLFGSDGNDTLNGGSKIDFLHGGNGFDELISGDGNDLLIYDPNDTKIEGGNGIDILRIDGDQHGLFSSTIDLTNNSAIKNMEALLLTNDAIQSSEVGISLKLSINDVLSFTDNNHTLTILGNQGDQVNISGVSSSTGWSYNKSAGIGSDSGFDVYQFTNNTTQQTATVKIETPQIDPISVHIHE